MDTSCAASVSYTDFSDFMRGHGSADMHQSACADMGSSSKLRSQSAGRCSPLKKTAANDSFYKSARSSKHNYSPKKSNCGACLAKSVTNLRQSSPIRQPSPQRSCSPVKCCPVRACSPCREPAVCRPSCCDPCYLSTCSYICRPCGPALCSGKEYDLVKALYDIIREERDLETAKINLARRADYNLYDAFRIFDTTNRGFITLGELRDGLAAIGLYPSTSDIELYIKRYDRQGDRRLRFSDFSDSFTPSTDLYSASTLNRRHSNNYPVSRFSARDDCFDAGTRIEFRAAWNTHFKVEAMCEGIRQRLRALPCFDLYSAFLTCDLYHDSVVSKDELRRLIDCRGFCVTETDAKHLVDKMDRDRDGVVSYSEVQTLISFNTHSFIVQRRT